MKILADPLNLVLVPRPVGIVNVHPIAGYGDIPVLIPRVEWAGPSLARGPKLARSRYLPASGFADLHTWGGVGVESSGDEDHP